MAEIQNTIKGYVDHANKCGRELSDNDLLAFVGMLETGEAELTDFVTVGGQSLAEAVCQHTAMIATIRGKAK